jgi:hypothetical protein
VLQQLFGVDIPNFDSLVCATASETVPTWMPYHAVDRGGMIIKRVNASTRAAVPQSYGFVITATYNQRAISANRTYMRTTQIEQRGCRMSPHGCTAHPVCVTVQSMTELLFLVVEVNVRKLKQRAASVLEWTKF